MKAEKIVTENIYLNIEEVRLLSEEEYIKYKDDIPLLNEWWWLQPSGRNHYLATIVSYDGLLFGRCVDVACAVVRPVLIISNLKSCNLSVGNKFKAANHTWTVISDTIALCDDSIGKQCFNSNRKEENSNNYETSDIKKYIDEWAEKESLVKKNMDYKRLLRIFQAYVENHLFDCYNPKYIRKILEQSATRKEIEQLGFGWLYPEEC